MKEKVLGNNAFHEKIGELVGHVTKLAQHGQLTEGNWLFVLTQLRKEVADQQEVEFYEKNQRYEIGKRHQD